MRSRKRRISILVGILVVSYLAVCVYFWATQVNKVLAPLGKIPTDPGRMGMAYERVEVPVGGGGVQAMLDGFWVPASNADAPAFLYLHGQDATIGKNLEHTQRLNQLGYHVLVVDYRGFGRSYGETKPSEAKVYQDAEAAWKYLTGNRGFEPHRVFIFGHSLGGAVAIELATRHPEAAGVIVESTFTSVLDMSKLRYYGALRLLPMDFLLHQRFDSHSKIGTLKIPILLMHGRDDAKVPLTMTERLYAAAPEPKELLLIAGGGHANSGSIGWVEYRETLTGFVGEHLKRAEDSADDQGRKDRRTGF
jgi:alpha-beta hydrolase superfamily lysophospholipase